MNGGGKVGETPEISRRTGHRVIATNRWLRLAEVQYAHPDGRAEPCTWEVVERTTTSAAAGADAVDIMALVHADAAGPTGLIVISQYRPPIDAVCLELPAGLIDPGEDPTAAALRELKEETGYHGTVTEVSPSLCYEPGMAASRFHLATMRVDMDDPRNQNPAPEFDEHEAIATHVVPLSGNVAAALQQLASRIGAVIDGKLYTLALGLGLRGN